MPTGAHYNDVGLIANYTEEINEIPTQFGLLGNLGMFSSEGIATDTVIIDNIANSLSVLPNVGRGGPATKNKGEKLSTIALPMPYFHLDDELRAKDLQNMRRPGSTGPDTATRKRVSKIHDLRSKVQQTHEWMRLGALKGVVTDGVGDVLLDIYAQWNVTQDVQFFNFADLTADMSTKTRDLKRTIEKNLQSGDMVSAIEVFVDAAFFDGLVTHDSVVEAYQFYTATNQSAGVAAGNSPSIPGGGQPLRDDLRRSFTYNGVVFREYNPLIAQSNGVPAQQIATNEGYATPVGVRNMYRSYFAPADKMTYVNTEGAEMYAFEYQKPKDEGSDFEVHSSALMVNTRPKSVIKVSGAAA